MSTPLNKSRADALRAATCQLGASYSEVTRSRDVVLHELSGSGLSPQRVSGHALPLDAPINSGHQQAMSLIADVVEHHPSDDLSETNNKLKLLNL